MSCIHTLKHYFPRVLLKSIQWIMRYSANRQTNTNLPTQAKTSLPFCLWWQAIKLFAIYPTTQKTTNQRQMKP